MTHHHHTLIFTDLDGTLLNAHDYSFAPVIPLIHDLTSTGVMICLATSKTLPEVIHWQNALSLNSPFMVENGAAVYFPAQHFDPEDFEGHHFSLEDRCYQLVLGTNISAFRPILAPFLEQITSLVDCTLEEAIALTGLSREEAINARQRQYTLPLIIKDPAIEEQLSISVQSAGFRTQKGGRFLHIQGNADKGTALELVRHIMTRKSGYRPTCIALGDNFNDLQMLEAADIAVVVKTDQSVSLPLRQRHIIYTEQVAPDGWVEGLSKALASITATGSSNEKELPHG